MAGSFLNVKGRGANRTINPSRYERVGDGPTGRLETITDEKGRPLEVKAFKPQQISSECRGIPPDLIV